MAVSRSLENLANEQADMDMTPMIDVTFLLLIFFMCTLHFKVLEGILQAHLPKDQGMQNTSAERDPEEPITVKILQSSRNVTVVWVGSEQFEGPRKYSRLFNKIRSIVQASPNSNPPVVIDPDIDVPFQDIVSTLNACRKVDESRPGKKPLQVKFAAKALEELENE
ncbi:ExbD/TolR family protein [Candidatus Uabimicrobium amorphum]|uniref:Biopolymer transporter ExbD n=1 Tax=Uabimicrobium amorphum TaxID=2596890 RepID=A0A5S9F314_UABAM|nr:biopolymer transporter ExbD [Candidatus Uabimicrobium amorphum]BBM83673.1 biopolymer transporter ExbD [Candidatus Uabimicrobium amorphum]